MEEGERQYPRQRKAFAYPAPQMSRGSLFYSLLCSSLNYFFSSLGQKIFLNHSSSIFLFKNRKSRRMSLPVQVVV